jgi:hypothetical protein
MGSMDTINAQEFGGYDREWTPERFRMELAKALSGDTADLMTVSPQSFQREQQMQQGQQGQSFDPMQAYDIYTKFAGGAAPIAQTGSGTISAGAGQASATGLYGAQSAGVVGSAAGGGAAGGGAAGGAAGGGGMGSALAGAGPWALLAAAIIANESKQSGDGNRGNSGWEHAGDLLTGKVLERDADRYLANNAAGDAGKRLLMMSTPSGAVRNLKDFGGWFKGLFD